MKNALVLFINFWFLNVIYSNNIILLDIKSSLTIWNLTKLEFVALDISKDKLSILDPWCWNISWCNESWNYDQGRKSSILIGLRKSVDFPLSSSQEGLTKWFSYDKGSFYFVEWFERKIWSLENCNSSKILIWLDASKVARF